MTSAIVGRHKALDPTLDREGERKNGAENREKRAVSTKTKAAEGWGTETRTRQESSDCARSKTCLLIIIVMTTITLTEHLLPGRTSLKASHLLSICSLTIFERQDFCPSVAVMLVGKHNKLVKYVVCEKVISAKDKNEAGRGIVLVRVGEEEGALARCPGEASLRR